jgi:hypothetical protein
MVDLTLGEVRSIGCKTRHSLVLAADCGRMTAQNVAICSEILVNANQASGID